MIDKFSVTHNPYRTMKGKEITQDIFVPWYTDEQYNDLGITHSRQLIEGYRNRTKNSLRNVVDYGCGDGRVARFMASKCNKIICADISSDILLCTAQRMLKYQVANFEVVLTDDLVQTNIDFIYSLQVLQHNTYAEQVQILEHIKLMLKENGVACIHFPKLDDKPSYVNSSNCMCFTFSQVEEFGKLFPHYEIEEAEFTPNWFDFYLWVKN